MAARKKAARKKAAHKKTARKKSVRTRTAQRARPRGAPSADVIAVYIHGIGQQGPPDALKLKWDLATFGKPMGERTRMAYWSDIVHPPEEPRARRIRTRRSARSLDLGAILAELEVEPDGAALELAEALAHAAAGVGAGELERRGARAKVLPLPRWLREPIAEQLLRWFVKDTAAYFLKPDIRERIRARLEAEIPRSGKPFVLVAHSQGTIVSYEVLSRSAAHAGVSRLLTLGSPLGLREVQDQIEDAGFPLRVPEGVQGWHNFADRLDPVALDASLANDFQPRAGVRILDELVLNRQTLHANPHSSVGYLAHPAVREAVYRPMGIDKESRFVVARDVAERLDHEERQPVLIEVLEPGYEAVDESSSDRVAREASHEERRLDTLAARIDDLATHIDRELVGAARGRDAERIRDDVRVQRLRKYVAARLTPSEIADIAHQHADMHVYAMWRSSAKSKYVRRSQVHLKADAARKSYGADGHGITWAVLDTGVRLDHPHFAADTIAELLDCTTHSDRPVRITRADRSDLDGHGTHVSGIIAGEAKTVVDGREATFSGLAPRARLLVYKVLDDQGFGEDAWIIKAIDDIWRRNENVTGLAVHGVNLSLGGPFDPSVYGCGFSPICKELADLWRQGVLVCVAAGNEGQIQVQTSDGALDLNTQLSIGDPANLEDCVAVGSVHADKPHLYGVSHFSSRGPTADGRGKPDVVAPGERIHSANSEFRRGGSLYRPDSGTSMACPHVSGLLAAFLSARREFIGEPDTVKRILLENCNDLRRNPYHQGAGLPNLMKMLLNT